MCCRHLAAATRTSTTSMHQPCFQSQHAESVSLLDMQDCFILPTAPPLFGPMACCPCCGWVQELMGNQALSHHVAAAVAHPSPARPGHSSSTRDISAPHHQQHGAGAGAWVSVPLPALLTHARSLRAHCRRALPPSPSLPRCRAFVASLFASARLAESASLLGLGVLDGGCGI